MLTQNIPLLLTAPLRKLIWQVKKNRTSKQA